MDGEAIGQSADALGDFTESDEFLVLRMAVRGLGSDDSEEGSAVERAITGLARRYDVPVAQVFRALNADLEERAATASSSSTQAQPVATSPGGPDLVDVIRASFDAAVNELLDDVAVLPLESWNESAFRHIFCLALAHDQPEVEQHLESDRIDLVLHRGAARALIEFKFYVHRPRIDPYSGHRRGFKGGPGLKNLKEFTRCIDRLAALDDAPGLSRYVILVYAHQRDLAATSGRSFGSYLADYEHPNPDVEVRLVASRSPSVDSTNQLHARLLAVTPHR